VGPIRVAVLAEDQLFLEGLRQLLARDADLFLAADHPDAADPAARADILLLDSGMDGALGLCSRQRRDGRPWVILVAGSSDEEWAVAALECGARGILDHSRHADDLLKAIRTVHEGQIWAPHAVIARFVDHHRAGLEGLGPSLAFERLSGREHEVLRLTVSGLCNKEIAERLHISGATVKAHLASIFRKLELHNRMELAVRYRDAVAAEAGRHTLVGQ
jgi:DNA-binding NarL/FixJ family response regulator